MIFSANIVFQLFLIVQFVQVELTSGLFAGLLENFDYGVSTVIVQTDCGYVHISGDYKDVNNANMTFTKISYMGEWEWSRTYSVGGELYFYDMTTTSDEEILITGIDYSSDSVIISKFNIDDANLIWSKELDIDDSVCYHGYMLVDKDDNDNIVIVCHMPTTEKNRSTLFIKSDSDGNVIFSKKWGLDGTLEGKSPTINLCTNCVNGNEGGYVISTVTASEELVILILNKNGVLVHAKEFKTGSNDRFPVSYSLQSRINGDLLVTGVIEPTKNYFLLRLDIEDLSVIWSKRVSGDASERVWPEMPRLEETTSGDIVVVGGQEIGGRKQWIIKFASNGSLLSSRILMDGEFSNIQRIPSDGSLLVSGRVSSDDFIGRIDPSGNADCFSGPEFTSVVGTSISDISLTVTSSESSSTMVMTGVSFEPHEFLDVYSEVDVNFTKISDGCTPPKSNEWCHPIFDSDDDDDDDSNDDDGNIYAIIGAIAGGSFGVLVLLSILTITCAFLLFLACCLFCLLFVLLAVCCVGSAAGGVSLFSGSGKKRRKMKKSAEKNEIGLEGGDETTTTSSSASLFINKDLFEIDYDDISLIEDIGSGGGGAIVYKAEWNDDVVAVKLFRKTSFSEHDDSYEEFERELSMMASISHPNLLRWFGCTMKYPKIGIVMEFCGNGDLLNCLANNTIQSVSDRVRVLKEIASGMSYLHERKILHRDLKPQNILIDGRHLRAKVMDFGLSRVISPKSVLTKRIGTSDFMAPEITIGSSYSFPVDVFSFSIIVFITLTNIYFPYGKSMTYVELKVSKDPDFRPKMPDDMIKKWEEYGWLIELMERAWNHDPDVRPSFKEIKRLFKEKNV